MVHFTAEYDAERGVIRWHTNDGQSGMDARIGPEQTFSDAFYWAGDIANKVAPTASFEFFTLGMGGGAIHYV